MDARRDDDALSWSGDDDPTLDVGAPGDQSRDQPADRPAVDAPPAALPPGYTAVGKGSGAVTDPHATDSASGSADGTADGFGGAAAGERAPVGNAALISLGVIGGVYALFAIGWLIGGLRLQGWRPFLVTDAMFQGSLWLAVLTPVLWFATVFLLTRASRAWVRFAWLGAGVVLLVPWPFVMIGAMGQ